MSYIACFFGVVWLIVGVANMHHALSHAKRYAYTPVTYDAWFWLFIAACAFTVSFFTSGAKP